MGDLESQTESVSDVDTALLDAELFVKYRAPERAIKRLRTALERSPRSIKLRERLHEIAAANKHLEEAARQCLALASLYIEREDFDIAYDRLLEAKQLDPRINIAAGLVAIRRARRPDLRPVSQPVAGKSESVNATLAGDLAAISVFDAIQVLENAKLTGSLTLTSETETGRLWFNDGTIVDADCAGEAGAAGFSQIVEITSGTFEFQKSTHTYPVNIQAPSNTNLILDALRRLDEEKQ
jgi:tetratricopeptide (TPR) repeat protein